ncbi:MAG: MFS transporter [Polaromonas sp.]|nr:MFS transporter [Polaromonas sp.]
MTPARPADPTTPTPVSIPAPTVKSAGWRLPAGTVFPLLALVLFAFFAAASAPSPLFVLFQHQWGFSPALLTVAFAIYALALLASLLVAGSLSDHIGRRPVVFVALLLQAAAMLAFLLAQGIGGLIAARIVQGIATGMVSGALTAAIVEAAPVSQKRLGAMIGSVSPLAGLAVGALLTGIAVQLASHPVGLVFGVLSVLCVAAAAATLFIPETVERRSGALASLVPRVSVPRRARGEFLRGLPVTFAVWALGGLYLALVPLLIQQVFDVRNGVVNGLAIAALFGMGSASPTLLRRLSPAATGVTGMTAMAVGVALLLLSLNSHSLALFFIGSLVAGFGSGAAFSSQMQTLAPLTDAHERAELFAAIYAVSYLFFSVPAMVAGLAVSHAGLLATAETYTLLLLLVSASGAWVKWRALQALPRA